MSNRAAARFAATRFDLIRDGIAVPQIALATAAVPDAAACAAEKARAFADGERIVYDPAHLDALPKEQRRGLIAEELLHTQLLHPWRVRALMTEGISLEVCQEAAEEAVMQVATACHLDMGEHPPADPEWEGYSLEAIARTKWARRKQGGGSGNQNGQNPPQGPQGGSQPGGQNPSPAAPGAAGARAAGGGQPGGGPPRIGTVLPAPDTSAAKQQKARVTAQLLAHAAGRGDLPAAMVRVVNQIRHPACEDLLEALLQWAARAMGARKEADWGRPDRYLAQLSGVVMASKRRRGLPPIGMAVDTSGSVQPAMLERFTACMERVLEEAEPERLYAWACDSEIHGGTREYRPGDAVDRDWPGGGGTDFCPVFEAAAALPEPIAGLVYLTDLDGRFPEREPGYPVLFVCADRTAARRTAPFGTTLYLD